MADAPSVSPLRQITPLSIGLGLLLAAVMGAGNVYVGLKAGMTVSASIPAAVVAMGLLRALRRRGVLEANLVQTAASAGESLAAGVIFTVPALVLTGLWDGFDYVQTTVIALAGGTLGVLLMIPMRKVFVVDRPDLTFPEGVACAEVLKASAEEPNAHKDQPRAADQAAGVLPAKSGLAVVATGAALGGLFKLVGAFFGWLTDTWETAGFFRGRVFFFGVDLSPMLVAVGVIVGLPIAVQIFLGGAIGWLLTLPVISGEAMSLSTVDGALVATVGDTADLTPAGAAWELWGSQVRYIGVGAMLIGGLTSIARVRKGLWAAGRSLLGTLRRERQTSIPTPEEDDLDRRLILGLTVAVFALIAGYYGYLLHWRPLMVVLTTAAAGVMGFFFTAVASYIVGLVGNSNSPVSGMTITAVLATAGLIGLFGFSGDEAILATLGVAGVVCCVACTSGDVCNDLKTGHLVGASPKAQQTLQLLGVGVAALVLAPTLHVLHQGSLNSGGAGIGGADIPAPQANLFRALAEGFFREDGHLPWTMVALGLGVGTALLLLDLLLAAAGSKFRLHVMPVAVGIYLPLGLSTAILLGGVLAWLASRGGAKAGAIRRGAGQEEGAARSAKAEQPGTLAASGVIAGESLAGLLCGLLAYLSLPTLRSLLTALKLAEETKQPGSDETSAGLITAVSLLAMAGVCAWLAIRIRQDAARPG